MADTFNSYDELASKYTEGTDYRIIENDYASDVCIVAPHAGKIELGTSEIAKAVAQDDFRLYLFEGCLRSGNRNLHITSHNFDEPLASKLVKKSRIVLGIHGRADSDDNNTIYLGGLDEEFMYLIATRLREKKFESQIGGHKFPARNKNNICNRGSFGMGAQIEVQKTLRDKFRQDAGLLASFAEAIRNSIEDKLNT